MAVKCLKEESNKSFIKEVSVLSQLDQKHDNIVKLYGICIQEDRIRMVRLPFNIAFSATYLSLSSLFS